MTIKDGKVPFRRVDGFRHLRGFVGKPPLYLAQDLSGLKEPYYRWKHIVQVKVARREDDVDSFKNIL